MKKVLIAAVVATVFICSAWQISAEVVPEPDIIGETLVVEPDDNIVKNNINNDKKDYTAETDKIIDMTREKYLKNYALPSVLLLAVAAATASVTRAAPRKRNETET